VLGSSNSGATWTTVSSSPHVGEKSHGYPEVVAVNDISAAIGHSIFLVGFPSTGWSLDIARVTRESTIRKVAVDSLPHKRVGFGNDAINGLLVQGVAEVGNEGWIQLIDVAIDAGGLPTPQLILLHTSDGGSSWTKIEQASI
jgi:hypothetical protein